MEVQVLVNNFQMYSTWIRTTPLIFFSIIAGALSDVFGRKPLILIPMIGYFLSSLVQIANYDFMEIIVNRDFIEIQTELFLKFIN